VRKKELGGLFGRIIDVHTHLPDDLEGPSPAALSQMVSLARHAGIGRLVLLGNLRGLTSDPTPSPELIADINSNTLRAMSEQPGLFIGFCYLNPAHPASFIREETERCVVAGGMRGIKLWIAVKATDPRLDPVMERAGELGVPVLQHAWYKAVAEAANESTPAEVASLARRFPAVTVIMAHLGGGRERGVLDVADCPNVLMDTSGSQPEAGMVEYAVRRLGPERVIFGSDWPVRDFGTQVGRVLGARLGPEERELVFRGNAARLLVLGQEAP
jgi:predicted TIM-barrel fold metal-dependent hydrolase